MRKNNIKRAYELLKDLTTVEEKKASNIRDHSGKCLIEERETLKQ